MQKSDQERCAQVFLVNYSVGRPRTPSRRSVLWKYAINGHTPRLNCARTRSDLVRSLRGVAIPSSHGRPIFFSHALAAWKSVPFASGSRKNAGIVLRQILYIVHTDNWSPAAHTARLATAFPSLRATRSHRLTTRHNSGVRTLPMCAMGRRIAFLYAIGGRAAVGTYGSLNPAKGKWGKSDVDSPGDVTGLIRTAALNRSGNRP
jgi:hypothetical protein